MSEAEARRKTFYLFDEDLDIIAQVAERYRVTDSSALRVILTEWAERRARTLIDTKAQYVTQQIGE